MTQNSINSRRRVIQRVTTSTATVVTCDTVIPRDNTIPQNTEGNQVLSLAITPKFSNSILEITFDATGTNSATNNAVQVALFQDSTANALTANSFRRGPNGALIYIKHIMTSGTTSSTTFAVRVGPQTAATFTYINGDATGNRLMGGVSIANLTILEYSP